MRGFGVIIAFNFIGFVLHKWLIPLPANVLGMVLLVAALASGWVKLAWIEEAASWLLGNMMLFFTPVIVGVILIFPKFESQLVPLIAGLVGSTVVVMLASGWTVQALNRKGREESQRGGC
ncbi:CidA/LrgA family protein [Brevibacillus ginsengisoli]|uniref:CidA/LrgA family protein n=1 Tax=Brevibacillus ginsengisoli TaxID=363854 RepID=UPI003CF03F57